jgi:hypothetical protein
VKYKEAKKNGREPWVKQGVGLYKMEKNRESKTWDLDQVKCIKDEAS